MMKYKSYGFWTALAGAVTLFVGTITKCFGISFNAAIVEDVIMAFAGILVVLGIVCMPIDKEKNPDSQDEKEDVCKIEENVCDDSNEKHEEESKKYSFQEKNSKNDDKNQN